MDKQTDRQEDRPTQMCTGSCTGELTNWATDIPTNYAGRWLGCWMRESGRPRASVPGDWHLVRLSIRQTGTTLLSKSYIWYHLLASCFSFMVPVRITRSGGQESYITLPCLRDFLNTVRSQQWRHCMQTWCSRRLTDTPWSLPKCGWSSGYHVYCRYA